MTYRHSYGKIENDREAIGLKKSSCMEKRSDILNSRYCFLFDIGKEERGKEK